MAERTEQREAIPPRSNGHANGSVRPCSIGALTALLAEAEAMSDSLGLGVTGAHIGKARDALRRSTGA